MLSAEEDVRHSEMASAAMRFASLMAEVEDDEATQTKETETEPQPARTAAAPAPEPVPQAELISESAAHLVERHRIEFAEIEENCRIKISESKKKSKIFREAAQEECANIKRECLERHEKEMFSLPAAELALARQLANTSIAEATVEDKPGFAYANADGKKKGKQQKRKEAKAEQEEKRYQEAKAAMKDWIDPKEVEERQLQVTAFQRSGVLILIPQVLIVWADEAGQDRNASPRRRG